MSLYNMINSDFYNGVYRGFKIFSYGKIESWYMLGEIYLLVIGNYVKVV